MSLRTALHLSISASQHSPCLTNFWPATTDSPLKCGSGGDFGHCNATLLSSTTSVLTSRTFNHGACSRLPALADEASAAASHDVLRDPATFLPGHEMGASVAGEEVVLVFKPYMDFLWRRLVEGVSGLQMLPLPAGLRLQRNKKGAKPARCCNWLLSGERLRRIRFTYFEAGTAGQAFNCLLYPDLRFDLPLLGIDLISLGASKILCVIDFLPLEQHPEYLEKYTRQLAPVKNAFIQHCGRMSSRFFDENQFFSKQLIFYRSDRGVQDDIIQVPQGELFRVYVEYVEEYFKSLQAAVAVQDKGSMEYVKSRQDAYDQYNSERDPAIKLFTAYFGEEWSKTCTEDFLFPGAQYTNSDSSD